MVMFHKEPIEILHVYQRIEPVKVLFQTFVLRVHQWLISGQHGSARSRDKSRCRLLMHGGNTGSITRVTAAFTRRTSGRPHSGAISQPEGGAPQPLDRQLIE